MGQWLKKMVGFFLLLIADQISKLWAVSWLKTEGPVPVIPNILELYYVENRGAAFGILQNKQWLFLLISIVVLGFLGWMMSKIPKGSHYLGLRLCLYFLAAGAVGNMIDRLFRNYVVDFIYFKLIDFPVFNVADIYVTTAAAVLIVLVIFFYKDEDWDKIFPKK